MKAFWIICGDTECSFLGDVSEIERLEMNGPLLHLESMSESMAVWELRTSGFPLEDLRNAN